MYKKPRKKTNNMRKKPSEYINTEQRTGIESCKKKKAE